VGHRTLAAVLGMGTALWHKALNPGSPAPPAPEIAALRRWLDRLIESDLANVEAGYYPRELALGFPMAELLGTLPEAISDLPKMWRRKQREAFDQLPALADDRYPDYYRRTFHWQTDGWFSAHSARVYDVQVEFLFFGTMEMMRRMSLPPLVRELREAAAPRMLDVACGTGRLLRDLQTLFPRAQLFGVDLSPHYVQHAQRAAAPGLSVIAANAEELPLADATFDAVTCGFLFHELPHDARRRVMAEMHRVLKPGGLLVFQDAAQWGDANVEELPFYVDWFPRAYHEPYFKGHLKDAVEAICREAGLTVESSTPALLSKVVVARK